MDPLILRLVFSSYPVTDAIECRLVCRELKTIHDAYYVPDSSQIQQIHNVSMYISLKIHRFAAWIHAVQPEAGAMQALVNKILTLNSTYESSLSPETLSERKSYIDMKVLNTYVCNPITVSQSLICRIEQYLDPEPISLEIIR